MEFTRRGFLGWGAAGSLAAVALPASAAVAGKAKDDRVGRTLPGWVKGHFQLHAIYTGVAESMLLIFPDGTTMLLDCGDMEAINRGKLAVPVLPSGSRHAGEWIARYVERVNPNGKNVDYLVVSHFHSDHTGCEGWHAGRTEGRNEDYFLSGFAQAAETLHFRTAVDRGWPDYNDPIPLSEEDDQGSLRNIKRLYGYLSGRDGLKIEKFRLGTADQFVPLRGTCDGFSVKNICANGRIVLPDGTIRDLYAEKLSGPKKPARLNENGMSLGFVLEYGKFSLYAAGDFSDSWKRPDGSWYFVEQELAAALGPVSVAKLNHHGYYSMPEALVKALRPKVWFSCVWDQLHDKRSTMERISSRASYPGPRLIAPGIFPARRRIEDAGCAWLDDLAPESFEGGHIVFDVPPGGETFTMSYVTADDESMKVTGVYDFRS